MQRLFLGWSQPALPAAAAYLCERYGSVHALDLSRLIVVVPGGGARRRLTELLVLHAEQAAKPLTPPEIITSGVLPERLYEGQKPFADALTQQFAWVQALRSFERAALSPVLPHPPADDDLLGWLTFAERLSRLHAELAADRLDFSDVLEQGKQLPFFDEAARWELLVRIRAEYLHRLDAQALWDKQTARLFAVEHGECRAEHDIVLVGTVDMNRTLRAMLDAPLVSGHATALVSAPQELADRFDEHGCLIPKRWTTASLDLPNECIEVVDGPGDQADAVARALAGYAGRYAASEITIGIVDETLVSFVRQRLCECGLRGRYGAGEPLNRSGPYQLLKSLAEYLVEPSTAAFASLVRHPALSRLLQDRGIDQDVASALDDYAAERLPARMDAEQVRHLTAENPVRRSVLLVEELCRPFRGPRRSLTEWGGAVLDALTTTYGNMELSLQEDAQRLIVEACDAVHAAVEAFTAVPAGLAPQISSEEAWQLLFRVGDDARMPPRTDPEAIELLGWLELPTDDAPALIVTGFNEGLVPQSLNGDLFLPNTLRSRLGIEDNEQRYARDAYVLATLAAVRRDFRVIAGRRAWDNSPLVPSRLLFAADGETAARRTLAFFGDHPPRRPILLPATCRAGAESARFAPPRPTKLTQPVTSLRVTSFRDYLACPYRFYLRHILKLEACNDLATELDDAQFGTLLHQVLDAFGKSEVKDSTDPEAIREYLDDVLRRLAEERFGSRALPAVYVQVEQIRRRLRAFAEWQAKWADDGKRIRFAEQSIAEVPFDVDGRPTYLRGRIDRIDYDESTQCWYIIDYKTGNSDKVPHKTHQAGDRWVDLQLPLYRHLAVPLRVTGRVKLGYVMIPAALDRIRFEEAPWTSAEMESADETARDVIRRVREEVFWPPSPEPPAFSEPYAAICLDDQFAAAARQFADAEEDV